ncbi:MAG: Ig-like domain-containing protein [Bacteroidaceae bacterium]|nr:Ig-like domain-containing protein [Bacteroidaceae bacterium]
MNRKAFHLFVGCVLLLLAACASIGTPDGGPYDETPPRLVASTPVERATNNKLKKIELVFNEFVKIENASEKVIISPPQIEQADIKASGKKVLVQLFDTLKANTTYSIDFSDAIVDNNENNPMGNFAFTFSTGEQIDSMEVSGVVLNAEDLEPIKGILVGLHSDLEDSAFVKKSIERVARTNGSGKFVIKGVAPGSYRIYALQDMDQNFMFSQKSEKIAFLPDTITTDCKPDIRLDTLWTDSIHYDTIMPVRYTHFYPDHIVLRAFTEVQTNRYLVKNERPLPNRFSLFFSSKSDTLPRLRGLNFDDKDAFLIEASENKDSLQYWIKDSLIIKKDTLSLELCYYATDTLGNLAVTTDTLNLPSKKTLEKIRKEEARKLEDWQKEQKKKQRRGEEVDSVPPVAPLPMKINPSGSLDPDRWVKFTFDEPVVAIDTSCIHLQLKQDSLWTEVDYAFEQVPGKLMEYQLVGEWRYEQEYQLIVDSACFRGLYGATTAPQKINLQVKTQDDYSSLFLRISGVEEPAFVELLNQDKPVKRVSVENGNADFYFVDPGKYYVRLIQDRNNDGKWTTGDYEKKIQAEEVYYYPGMLELKKQWEITQDWDVAATPWEKQKPAEIVKQKPDAAKSVKKRNADREKQKRQQAQPARQTR